MTTVRHVIARSTATKQSRRAASWPLANRPVEAFGEPAEDWGEKGNRLFAPALLPAQASEAHRTALFPGFRVLPAGDVAALFDGRLGLAQRPGAGGLTLPRCSVPPASSSSPGTIDIRRGQIETSSIWSAPPVPRHSGWRKGWAAVEFLHTLFRRGEGGRGRGHLLGAYHQEGELWIAHRRLCR